MADQARARRTERTKDQVPSFLNDHRIYYSLVGNKKEKNFPLTKRKGKQRKFLLTFLELVTLGDETTVILSAHCSMSVVQRNPKLFVV